MTSTTNLPKHIKQMVEKNNLVQAIKSLSEEQNISINDAKQMIDSYESQLKQKQALQLEKIISKQQKKNSKQQSKSTPKLGIDTDNNLQNNKQSITSLNAGLDKRLSDLGYKKPLLPYWAKRLFIYIFIVVTLSFLFWHFFTSQL